MSSRLQEITALLEQKQQELQDAKASIQQHEKQSTTMLEQAETLKAQLSSMEQQMAEAD